MIFHSERFELDLMIGGLTRDTPWRQRVGLTRPYLTAKTVLGIAAGEPAPASLDGMRVAIQRGDPAGARLRARGATPVWVDRLAPGQAPAAVDDWRLSALGLQDSGIRLRQVRHVMAVPPGSSGVPETSRLGPSTRRSPSSGKITSFGVPFDA